MAYAWTITVDHIATNAEGTIGPSGATLDAEQIKEHGSFFMMYDDDGVLYYEGYVTGNFCGLEPLHDFGMPNAGCTMIKMRNLTGSFSIV